MKRRSFLARAAAFSLLAPSAFAAPQKPASKPATKPATKTVKPTTKPVRKPVASAPAKPIRSFPLNTADRSVIDAPPAGSSASRLPPVKAPDLPDVWQDYEVTTQVVLSRTGRNTRVWLPLPLNQENLYQRNLGFEIQGNAQSIRVKRLPDGEQEMLIASWSGEEDMRLNLRQRVSTAERVFDITKRTQPPEREDILRTHLRASTTVPNEGEIYDLALRIVGRIHDPVPQAKAIFDWVTENAAYLQDLPGGGTGAVREQIKSGRFGGGSVDISALFVGLCRSLGIPARLVFGLKVDRSLMTEKLSTTPDDLRKSQHCRAEFYVPGYNWIPVDPAGVCRVSTLGSLNSRDLSMLRRVLFGTWEMNWIAYGMGIDVQLGSERGTVPFLNQAMIAVGKDSPRVLDNQHSAFQTYLIRSQRTLTPI